MPRLAFISDTHTQQSQLTQHLVGAGVDILVHSGDFCGDGERLSEVGDFVDWCSMLLKKGYVKHMALVAGNHDQPLDPTCAFVRYGRQELPAQARDRVKRSGVTYLEDSAATIMGLTFYGTPWVKRCGDWGFMIDDAGQDERVFNRVRDSIDVLVTHSPPLGIMDEWIDVIKKEDGSVRHELRNEGSPALRRAIERTRPRIHSFGHVHQGRGMQMTNFGVLCINAASCDSENSLRHLPVIVDLEPRPE